MLDRWIDDHRLPVRLTAWLWALAMLAVMGFGATRAQAATVEVEWQWPTLRTDGTPLPVAELREIVIEHGACNATNTGLTETAGTVTAAPPTTVLQFQRPAGPACVQAHIVDTAGLESARVVVPFTAVDQPPGSPPGPPVVVRIVIVFPADPPPDPPAPAFAVVGRSTSAGMTTKNRVYDVRSYGPQLVGELSVGKPCDCSDERTEAWGAGTGRYCRVDGQVNETRTTYLALGAPFKSGSWTRCEATP